MNDDVQMKPLFGLKIVFFDLKKKRKSLSDFTPNCSSERAPLFLFFFAFFFSGFI